VQVKGTKYLGAEEEYNSRQKTLKEDSERTSFDFPILREEEIEGITGPMRDFDELKWLCSYKHIRVTIKTSCY